MSDLGQVHRVNVLEINLDLDTVRPMHYDAVIDGGMDRDR
jgi:hypothetical protein